MAKELKPDLSKNTKIGDRFACTCEALQEELKKYVYCELCRKITTGLSTKCQLWASA